MRRSAGRRAPLSFGVYSLTITAVAYLPGAAIGWWLLDRGALDGLDLAASPGMISVTDTLFGWLPDLPDDALPGAMLFPIRSEEHTSELQSLMRISYAVFCLKKQNRLNPSHCNSR